MENIIKLIDANIQTNKSEKQLAQLQMLDHNLMGADAPPHSPEYYEGCIDSLTKLKSYFSKE